MAVAEVNMKTKSFVSLLSVLVAVFIIAPVPVQAHHSQSERVDPTWSADDPVDWDDQLGSAFEANVGAAPVEAAESSEILASASITTPRHFFVHVVRRGETLSALAQRFRTTVRTLARVNRLRNPNRIFVGQRLLIPLRRVN